MDLLKLEIVTLRQEARHSLVAQEKILANPHVSTYSLRDISMYYGLTNSVRIKAQEMLLVHPKVTKPYFRDILRNPHTELIALKALEALLAQPKVSNVDMRNAACECPIESVALKALEALLAHSKTSKAELRYISIRADTEQTALKALETLLVHPKVTNGDIIQIYKDSLRYTIICKAFKSLSEDFNVSASELRNMSANSRTEIAAMMALEKLFSHPKVSEKHLNFICYKNRKGSVKSKAQTMLEQLKQSHV